MAKIKKERLIIRDPNSKSLEDGLAFDVDINVSSDGLFYTTLPDNICELLAKMNISLETNRKGKNGYFKGNSIDELIRNIKNVVSDYFEREVTYDNIIIKYSIRTYCNYILDDDGKVAPNGHYAEDFQSRNHITDGWKSGTKEKSATESYPFSISVYAEPMRKLVYQYKSGKTTTEYENIKFTNNDNRFYLKWLNDVIGISPVRDSLSGELEYTEERAKFFVDMITGICNLNEKIKQIFQSEDNLKMLIDNGTKLLS